MVYLHAADVDDLSPRFHGAVGILLLNDLHIRGKLEQGQR
jgi:hypothetical protein